MKNKSQRPLCGTFFLLRSPSNANAASPAIKRIFGNFFARSLSQSQPNIARSNLGPPPKLELWPLHHELIQCGPSQPSNKGNTGFFVQIKLRKKIGKNPRK